MTMIPVTDCNPQVKLIDGELFFGQYLVTLDGMPRAGEIPALYTVRCMRDGWWQLCATLDLIGDKFWMCGVTRADGTNIPASLYDSIEALVSDLQQAHDFSLPWAIFEEEDFDQWLDDLPTAVDCL
jgi:hypothetical protein